MANIFVAQDDLFRAFGHTPTMKGCMVLCGALTHCFFRMFPELFLVCCNFPTKKSIGACPSFLGVHASRFCAKEFLLDLRLVSLRLPVPTRVYYFACLSEKLPRVFKRSHCFTEIFLVFPCVLYVRPWVSFLVLTFTRSPTSFHRDA